MSTKKQQRQLAREAKQVKASGQEPTPQQKKALRAKRKEAKRNGG